MKGAGPGTAGSEKHKKPQLVITSCSQKGSFLLENILIMSDINLL